MLSVANSVKRLIKAGSNFGVTETHSGLSELKGFTLSMVLDYNLQHNQVYFYQELLLMQFHYMETSIWIKLEIITTIVCKMWHNWLHYKIISSLVTADSKTGLKNNCFWTVGLVGSAKFGDLVKSEEPQLSETLLAVKEILTWDLTFATFF